MTALTNSAVLILALASSCVALAKSPDDPAYGDGGTSGRLRSVPIESAIGGSGPAASVATGAGEIAVRAPRQVPGTVLASDYGFSTTNDDNGAAIERALAAAKAAGAGRLELAPGTYRCHGPRGVTIDGFEDFVIDGKGAELVFRRDPTYPIVPSWKHDPDRANFVIRNCRRVRIGGFDMDWDWRTAPLATGAVVTRVHVDDERDLASFVEFELLGHGSRHPYYGGVFPVQHMNPMSDRFRRFGDRNTWWMGTYEGEDGAKSEWVDPVHVRIYPAVYDPAARHWTGPNGVWSDADANRRQAARLKPGDIVRLSHRYYGKGGFTLDSNEDFVLHDVNVYACFGFGVYVDGTQRNWMLKNVKFAPRDMRHPISCSADTIHFASSCGSAIVDGFRSSYGQDDSINVHDRFTVARPAGERELSVALKRGAAYFMPKVGHEVELRLPTLHPTGWRGKVVAVDGARMVFDRPVPRDADFYLVFDRGSSCDRLVFRNSVVEDSEQRCLFNASDVTIENCVFRRMNGDAVRLLADYTLTYWCEGTGVTNLVLRNCLFDNCCTGRQRDCPWNTGAALATRIGLPPEVEIAAADKSYVSKMLVEGCTFRDSLLYAAAFDFGRDIVFRRNTVEETGLRRDAIPGAGSIRVRHVANACFEDNRFVVPRGGERPSFHVGEDVSGLTIRRNVCVEGAEVLFTEETGIVRNPGQGWSALGDARSFDAAAAIVNVGAVYARFPWARLEPEEGRYDWKPIEDILDFAAGRGLPASFRVMCANMHDSTGWPTPKWVFDLGAKDAPLFIAKGAHGQKADIVHHTPVFDDPVFMAAHRRFVAALAKRYDGDPRLGGLDIGSFGNWGEWHCYGLPPEGKTYSPDVRRQYAQWYVDGFKKTPLVFMTDDFETLKWALGDGPVARVGIRRDGVGSPWHFAHWIGKPPYDAVPRMGDVWQDRPVWLEFFGGAKSMLAKGWDLPYAVEWMLTNHVSVVNTFPFNPVEIGDSAGHRSLLRKIDLYAGARLVPERAFVRRDGRKVSVALSGVNKGVARIYLPYRAEVVALDADGNERFVHAVAEDPGSWLPGPFGFSCDFDLDPSLEDVGLRFAARLRHRGGVFGNFRFSVKESDSSGMLPLGLLR